MSFNNTVARQLATFRSVSSFLKINFVNFSQNANVSFIALVEVTYTLSSASPISFKTFLCCCVVSSPMSPLMSPSYPGSWISRGTQSPPPPPLRDRTFQIRFRHNLGSQPLSCSGRGPLCNTLPGHNSVSYHDVIVVLLELSES